MIDQIQPCLWFDGNAKAAAEFYCGIFPSSKITSESPMVVSFELNGQSFTGLNGGNQFKFNEAVSFVVRCKDQAEIDFYWNSLIADGGSEGKCGWCKDKFGLSWQIIPHNLGSLLSTSNSSKNVMETFMNMKKIEIERLK